MTDYSGQTWTAWIPIGRGVDRPADLTQQDLDMLVQFALDDGAATHGCTWASWRIAEDDARTPAWTYGCGERDHEHTDDCWVWDHDEEGRPMFDWALLVKAVAA